MKIQAKSDPNKVANEMSMKDAEMLRLLCSHAFPAITKTNARNI